MGFLNMAKAHFTAASPAQSQAEQQQLQKVIMLANALTGGREWGCPA